jgi:hypothetical protein
MRLERLLLLSVIVMVACAIASVAHAEPRVELIPLDGATPRLGDDAAGTAALPVPNFCGAQRRGIPFRGTAGHDRDRVHNDDSTLRRDL